MEMIKLMDVNSDGEIRQGLGWMCWAVGRHQWVGCVCARACVHVCVHSPPAAMLAAVLAQLARV